MVEVICPKIEKIEEQKPDIIRERLMREFRVKTLLSHIIECKKGFWLNIACKKCENIIEEKVAQGTCNIRYCDCERCVERRREKAWHRLKDFEVYSKRLIHLEIGFPLQKKETKEDKQRRDKTLKQIKKEFKKIIEIHGLMVLDIRERKEFYFVHYHLALLPVKGYRLFMQTIRKIQEKFKGKATIRNEGYKPRESLFSYFSRIMAGLISSEDRHHSVLYKEIMTPEEYIDFFYRRRVLRAVCVSKPERSEVMFKCLGLTLPAKCPFCNAELTFDDVKLVKDKEIEEPPPPEQKHHYHSIEIVSNWRNLFGSWEGAEPPCEQNLQKIYGEVNINLM